MADKYVYLAVGMDKTRLYRFDPTDWDIALVDKVPAYQGYYAAMAEQDGMLYALSDHNLVTINPEGGSPVPQPVEGLSLSGRWFCGDMMPGGTTLIACAGPTDHTYEINLATRVATALNPAGPGRWDDWSYHPNDGRLYAVEGDNGNLLYMDFSRNPAEVTLKKATFPLAEKSSSGGRKAYSAVFFDEDGNFYAIDSKGNVNVLDLTASTKSDPVTEESVGLSRRIGNTPLPVGDLEVLNAAGLIKKIPVIPPPVITEPKDQASVLPDQVVRGTVAEGVDAVRLLEDVGGSQKPLGAAQLSGTDWTYTPAANWSDGNHTILAVACKGKQDSLPATVHFTVHEAPVSIPVITEPKDQASVLPDQVVRGTVAEGVDAVRLLEDVGGSQKPLGAARLSGTDWTYTPAANWSDGNHTILAVACKGKQESSPATVHFTVHKSPVNIPLTMAGPKSADSGTQITYTVTVENSGPGPAPDAEVAGVIPAELSELSLAIGELSGHATAGAGSTAGGILKQPLNLPMGGRAVILLTGTIKKNYTGSITCTTEIKTPGRTNTATQTSGSVTTKVVEPKVLVTIKKVNGFPQSYPPEHTGWVCSYSFELGANKERVTLWELSFDGLPKQCTLNPENRPEWLIVVKDGSDGEVIVRSKSGHTIDPGTPLPVTLQLLYFGSSKITCSETLQNLRAIEHIE
ncbi:hypothetical protein OG413_25250 [Streptomyces sp. NBC_01433]|uniref:DUF6923 family protein n=1 Tax=Streptomyces sp. NBC_01433 TaxID=2903864 RepID=UPI00225C103F|nr:hypothetical protein [Streptomyces sp. NBC_01433]MCX4678573.1 hypothetical protein [Streptomyces sp. NBC_01433]